jgi:hypothetical protein
MQEGVFIGLLAAAVLISLAVVPGAARCAAASADEVILKSRHFVPDKGLSGSLQRRLAVNAGGAALRVAGQDETAPGQAAGQPGRVHVIVQLEDVPTVERRAELFRGGLRLLSYIPTRAWLASAEADTLPAIAHLPGVCAVTEILPQDKLAASIATQGINACSRLADGRARLIVFLFEDVEIAAGKAGVEALGGACVELDPDQHCIVCNLPTGAVDALAARDGVKWIDQHYESLDLNDGVRAAIRANEVQAAPYNLTGAGVVIGQWESSHPDANHVDLAGRVLNIDDGRAVGDHATLVAGTMIGDGRLLPSRRYRGVATAAAVVSFRDWTDAVELRKQYRDAISLYGIDIANNSWGKVEWSLYKDYAGLLDAIVRGDLGKRISMVWAVGNGGGWSAILCTATGKNVITVGATNSDDDSLWQWSNKGPTEDGRIKPDVVSPGCETGNGGAIWSTLPGNRYGGACGTSLAAPSVSGTLALVLEDWRATHGADPRPATLKALLLHAALDLGNPGPDYSYGYGLIDAEAAVDLARSDTLDETVVEATLEQPGQSDGYPLDVAADAKTLKLTLVWDDYPADPLAAPALVNDLDLVVTGPDGKRYYPWTLDPYAPQEPAVRTRADHTNNVEQVCVDRPVEGRWQIAVTGTAVPQCPQTYSLILDPMGAESASNGTLLSVAGGLGQTVARFDDRGNLVLSGELTIATEAAALPPAGAFVLEGPDQSVAGYIDLLGNLCIRGELYELSDCEPAGGGFAVKDGSGSTVASIDAAGNLCLAGRLHQDAQP